MSDPMEDEELLSFVQVAIFAGLVDYASFDVISEAAVRAILDAGYRIVKPEPGWADMAAYEVSEDDFGSDRIAHSTGDRRFVIETILADSKDRHEIMETITVPVSRASLLAELESMKEVGE